MKKICIKETRTRIIKGKQYIRTYTKINDIPNARNIQSIKYEFCKRVSHSKTFS